MHSVGRLPPAVAATVQPTAIACWAEKLITNHRTNEIMRVLTIVSSIFIPLTFIAGLYGMNLANMPELHLRFGYPVVLIIMLAVATGMILFFKRKNWL
jgi:magnesium transporter